MPKSAGQLKDPLGAPGSRQSARRSGASLSPPLTTTWEGNEKVKWSPGRGPLRWTASRLGGPELEQRAGRACRRVAERCEAGADPQSASNSASTSRDPSARRVAWPGPGRVLSPARRRLIRMPL